MTQPGHETGWLELKADITSGKEVKFRVEASQHQWIQLHLGRVPIHFLLGINNTLFFLDAKHHARLAHKIAITELTDIAIATFPGDRMAENSFLFSNATLRNRHELQGV